MVGLTNFVARGRLTAWGIFSLAILSLVVDSGCARLGNGLRRKPAPPLQTSMTPPTVEGSAVRSQDAGKLTKRVAPKRGGQDGTAPLDLAKGIEKSKVTQLPVVEVNPQAKKPDLQAEVAPLPEPPELPVDRPAATPGEIARTVEASVGGEQAIVAMMPPQLADSSRAEGLGGSAIQEPEFPVADKPANASDAVKIHGLIVSARTRLSQFTSYQARLKRQERVGANLQPAEEVLLSIRREPIAVRLEWPTGTNKGREVLYSPVETAGKLQIYQPASLMPRMTLNPESPLVLKNSRHPISEAGFDKLLAKLERTVQESENGSMEIATLSYEGAVEVAEVGRLCHRITEVRSNGETWVVCLDTESLMPTQVRGVAADGALLEMYLFTDISFDVPELATPTAFVADARWGKGGLLNRLATAPAESSETAQSVAR